MKEGLEVGWLYTNFTIIKLKEGCDFCLFKCDDLHSVWAPFVFCQLIVFN
jgi:hypothetical protein